MTTADQPIKPDAVETVDQAGAATTDQAGEAAPAGVGLPTKLIRIASMTRAMLEEVRQTTLDEQGKARLASVHSQTLEELREMLPQDLVEEFNDIMVPVNQTTPSESELRIAQAQLIGWLEGLFHGIQASLWSQQMAAQAQLQEMQRRAGIGKGQTPDGEQQGGLYL
jgi:hypothetical protein